MLTNDGPPRDSSRQATLLLVDDDPSILDGVTDLLTLAGYRVITAVSGSGALGVLQQQRPDLIISDIMMPDMDGYELFSAIRSNPNWAPIPFIFLTARGQPSDVRTGNSLGVDAYITKPFEPDTLLGIVQGRLRRLQDIQMMAQNEIDRMKSQLISVFSHELRTPLTYVYGYASLLLEGFDDFEREIIISMLNGVQRGAERLTVLVEDLMTLVRIDSGVVEMDIRLHRAECDLPTLVERVVTKLAPRAAERGVAVKASLPQRLSASIAASYIEDAVSRIVDNAIKFAHEGCGHVWISGEAAGDEVVIRVRDDGIGIDPAQQSHIFERFEQIDRDMMEQQGVGLGLTLAREVVRLHGGDITVQSEPGAGSVFAIRLPATKGEP
jgi:two-component system sensor histidine kinase/response regulator